ncbi:hypothetical protein BDU57DRAFT_122119 [Ampelomyces quisqualis]|uniref:Uncharacterized protein n=1 Tax=Ampelomyces quisqualis TaxID=50730 RepID=A0A6A5QTW3_AMPQU|nr:hypothetical protein BDU57DRAFT_122119 [Ampelomyces quisqualis]
MSSITPASFVDDGGSFHKRVPHGLHPAHISRWLNSAGSDTTSAYTGSYIDDGADMLPPSSASPGFGKVDPRFYKQRKRRGDEHHAAWNEDIQKAVAGDIGRSLEKMRHIGSMEVKRAAKPNRARDEKARSKKKDTVTIPMPPKWGTFIIKADDGRVIVVDRHGEFDSGPQVRQKHDQLGTRWVKAPETISLPSSPPSDTSSRGHKDKKKHKHRLPEPLKSLTPIAESEYEDDGYEPSGEDVMSPTGLFMTGGKDGWPASKSGSAASPVRSSKPSCTDSLIVNKKAASPVRSPPGSWPQSPTQASQTATSESIGSGTSRRWQASKTSARREAENISLKSYSTYRPATVEDAPDTSSENASMAKHGDAWGGGDSAWGGSVKGSKRSGNEDKSSISSSKSSHWIAGRVETISDNSSPLRSRRASSAPSGNAWDGYELPKTLSEVSVAGTGSERGSLGGNSQRTWRASEHVGSQAGWGGSQGAMVDGWGGDRTDSGSGSASAGGYKNGYDEDDERYLNDSWSGVRVRVRNRTRKGHVVGWEG